MMKFLACVGCWAIKRADYKGFGSIMPSPTCKQIMPIVGEKVFGNYTRHLGAL